MLHDPQEQRLFPRFTPEQIRLLSRFGDVLEFAPGEALFEQGKRPYHFWVVLEGKVKVTKRSGGEEILLTVHKPGEFAAELSILSGAAPIASGRAVGPVKALRIEAGRLRELIAGDAEAAGVILPALTGRLQEVDQTLRQQEKLAALGRMAAGLAHELNNPAAAVKRAAATLDESVAEAQNALIRLHAHAVDAGQQAFLTRLHDEARGYCASPIPLTPLQRSGREDEVGDWLDDHGVEKGWEVAPVLVVGGITPAKLEQVRERMGEERLDAVVRWLAATLTATTLLRELRQGTERISLLVSSIKQYSHMDQAPELKEADLHAGLESTLALLAHKLKAGVEVVRDYDPSLPKVCVYPGELNQVWTNLIDNAVDAMGGAGTITVRTRRDDASGVVNVEIADDGPGIPPEILERVWEPFFTTKGVGEGSGLGLDIARRIVQRRHGGTIKLTSAPGDTRFLITLRIEGPPKQSERAAEEAEDDDFDLAAASLDAALGEESPVDAEPSGDRASGIRSADGSPETGSTDGDSGDARSDDARSIDASSTPSRSIDAGPTESRPTESRPTESRSTDSSSTESRSTGSPSTDTGSTDADSAVSSSDDVDERERAETHA